MVYAIVRRFIIDAEQRLGLVCSSRHWKEKAVAFQKVSYYLLKTLALQLLPPGSCKPVSRTDLPVCTAAVLELQPVLRKELEPLMSGSLVSFRLLSGAFQQFVSKHTLRGLYCVKLSVTL